MMDQKTGIIRQLLDRDAPEGYVQEWTARIAAPIPEARIDLGRALVLRIGTECLALPLQFIRELVELRPVHRLPHQANRTLLGVVNIRGRLTACVSLGQFLNITDPADLEKSKPSRLIVLGDDKFHLAFPAHEVHGVQQFSARELQPPPYTHSDASYTLGMLAWNSKNVAFIDGSALLTALRKSLS